MSVEQRFNGSLAVAVPLLISELMTLTPPSRTRVRKEWVAEAMAARDQLRLKKGKIGLAEGQDAFDHLARTLAALAFNPGGVTYFGQHWEASDRHALYSFTPRPHADSAAHNW